MEHAKDFPDNLLHIRARIEQAMGTAWMESRRILTTAALFDQFIEAPRTRGGRCWNLELPAPSTKKYWLNYSDLIAAFAAGLLRSHRWRRGVRLCPYYEERVNLFAQEVMAIWPPAISAEVSLIEVELGHFNEFVEHFLKTRCPDWGYVTGPNFDLDGTRLDVLQELRRNIEQFEGKPCP